MRMSERTAEPLKHTQAMILAGRLAQLGARPPTIGALLPYLTDKVIKDIWEEVRGERSRRGPTPYTLHAHFSSPLRRIQSTYALVTFREFRRTGIHDIEAMIATYERYCQQFGEQTETNDQRCLSFDRLWFLVKKFLNDRTVVLEKCPCCGHLHIHDPNRLLSARDCPFAKLIPDFNTLMPAMVTPNAQPAKPAETPKIPDEELMNFMETSRGLFIGQRKTLN